MGVGVLSKKTSEMPEGARRQWRADRALRPAMRSPGRPEPSRAVQRQFWRLIATGITSADAALRVGVSVPVGSRWYRHAGGMTPLSLTEPTGRFLSFAEREEIALLKAQGKGVREIARTVGRDPGTISRELRRNAATRSGRLEYRALVAQWKAQQAAKRPKTAKLVNNERLREYVQDRLAGNVRRPDGTIMSGPTPPPWKGLNKPHRQDRQWSTAWSPEQISNRLKVEFPHDESMRISHEAIYQSLFIQGRGALKRELVACLRTGRALRQPRARSRNRPQGHVTADVVLSERPAEVDDRAVTRPLGIPMLLSSSSSGSEGWLRGVGAVVADQGPEDVDAAAGEGDQRLLVGSARGSLLLVVVAVGAIGAQARQRRQVQGVPKRSRIAAGFVDVADPPSGVLRAGYQPGCGGQVTGVGVAAQVAGGGEQHRTEDGSEAGHRLDRPRVGVGPERGGQLGLEGLQPFVERQDVGGDLDDEGGGDVFPGQAHLLGSGCLDRAGCDLGVAADAASTQPSRQAGLTHPGQPLRRRIPRQQHQRALVRRVLERTLQRRRHARQQRPEPVHAQGRHTVKRVSSAAIAQQRLDRVSHRPPGRAELPGDPGDRGVLPRSCRTAHQHARTVSSARGRASTGCCSVTAPPGHADSTHRQVRLRHTSRTGLPKHGVSISVTSRRP